MIEKLILLIAQLVVFTSCLQFEYRQSTFRITTAELDCKNLTKTIYLNINAKLGENIGFECPRCDQTPVSAPVKWRASDLKKQFVEVRTKEKTRFHIHNSTGVLFIPSAEIFDSNLYQCAGFELVLFNLLLSETRRKPVLVSKTDKIANVNFAFKPLPNSTHTTLENGLLIETHWSDWSVCYDCDAESIRYRTGSCSVSYRTHSPTFDFYLSKINESLSGGAWPCSQTFYFRFLSFTSLQKDIFNDYIEYENCSVLCHDADYLNQKKEVKKQEKLVKINISIQDVPII
jgi:hypothetical protein